MADVVESAQFTDPATAISHGKRHLLVRDYTMAVTALAQACQLLAEKHGDTADELGEPYLLYGRALLGLAREEAGVLGGAVPGSEEAEEDEEEDEEEGDAEEEKLSNVDEKEEDEEDEERRSNGASSSSEAKETKVTSVSKTDDSKVAEEAAKSEEGKKEEKAESSAPSEKSEKHESNKTDDSKIAEQVAQKQKAEVEEKENVTPGSSKESHSNGPSSSAEQNGDLKENGENGSEDTGKEDNEDEVNNLQVAWEVLELAKLVLLKRGQSGWKLLADAYRLLGEVAMEGGNYQGALNDLQGCLELLQKIEPREPRAIAEIHYQLALAHSLGNEFDASIEQFNEATSLLEARIKELEEMKDPPKSDDSFYTVEGEIQELKELLPEIQEKISDMKDFKQEACKLVIEGIKSKVAGGCSNGAGPSSSDSGSSTSPKVQKPASDISHLVRKKRKADEPETEVSSPCKKPTPEKAV